MPPKIHDFKNKLSESFIFSSKIDEWYKQHWNVSDIINYEKDKQMQKQGIDKGVVINSTLYTIEEKCREAKYFKYWDKDILIETISMTSNDTPGWIYTSKADILSYYFISNRASEIYLYLFPMKDWLMPWWIKNCYKYETVPDKIACNRTYNTISKPVPFKDIFTALKNDGIEKYCQHYVINVEDKFVDPNPDSF